MTTNEKTLMAVPILNGKIPSKEDISTQMSQIKNHRGPILSKTSTTETNELYLKTAKNKIDSIISQYGQATNTEIIDWLRSKSETVKDSTFRFYKSAFLFHFKHEYAKTGDTDHLELCKQISLLKGKPKSGGVDRNSSKKKKQISDSELAALLATLSSTTGSWATIAILFIKASLATGLRPSEWEETSITEIIKDSGLVITVKNGKATNNRSFGEARTMFIPNGAGAAEVRELIECVSAWKSLGRDYGIMQKMLYRRIRSSSIKALGKKNAVCMYTFRHQFSANVKNVYTKEEVSALLGHISINTAITHYSKKNKGWIAFSGMNEEPGFAKKLIYEIKREGINLDVSEKQYTQIEQIPVQSE